MSDCCNMEEKISLLPTPVFAFFFASYDSVQYFISLFAFHARKSHRFAMTQRCLIEDRIFISAWTVDSSKNITEQDFQAEDFRWNCFRRNGTSCCQRNEESRGEEQNEKGEVELLSEPLMSPSLLSFYCIAQAGLESVLWNNVKSTH